MNSPDATLQDQLRRQSEPFDALWACRTRVSDETYLTPLKDHALRVLRVVSSLSSGGGSSPAWDGVYYNLHQALSPRTIPFAGHHRSSGGQSRCVVWRRRLGRGDHIRTAKGKSARRKKSGSREMCHFCLIHGSEVHPQHLERLP